MVAGVANSKAEGTFRCHIPDAGSEEPMKKWRKGAMKSLPKTQAAATGLPAEKGKGCS